MKKIVIILLGIIILTSLISCGNKSDENALEIYLVSGDLPDGENIDINKLVLEETPIITLDDIQRYYWEDQAFVMEKDLLRERLDEQTGKIYATRGFPYVVVVNGERIYMGKFWSALSSSMEINYPLIYIEFPAMGKDTDEYINLEPEQQLYAVTFNKLLDDDGNWVNKHATQGIFDKRIKKVLEKAGLLVEIEQ